MVAGNICPGVRLEVGWGTGMGIQARLGQGIWDPKKA